MRFIHNNTLFMQRVPVRCCSNHVHHHLWYLLKGSVHFSIMWLSSLYDTVCVKTLYEQLVYFLRVLSVLYGQNFVFISVCQCLYLDVMVTVYFSDLSVEGHCVLGPSASCFYPLCRHSLTSKLQKRKQLKRIQNLFEYNTRLSCKILACCPTFEARASSICWTVETS